MTLARVVMLAALLLLLSLLHGASADDEFPCGRLQRLRNFEPTALISFPRSGYGSIHAYC